jgi:Fungal ATP synthase protein 8 (A6L)
MPQLVPFFFSHQITLVFFALALLLSLFSKYILPNILSIYLGRHTLADKMNS